MKKVLLTSAAVLAVFASSAAVFANDGNVHTGNLDNKTEATGGDFFTNNEGGLTQAAKDGLNNVDADSTKQKFEDAGLVYARKHSPGPETISDVPHSLSNNTHSRPARVEFARRPKKSAP